MKIKVTILTVHQADCVVEAPNEEQAKEMVSRSLIEDDEFALYNSRETCMLNLELWKTERVK